ncbi:MAG: acyltransferase [Bacteroidota bacterium]|nr:acyltransferase [Bacteroidota bacterium]
MPTIRIYGLDILRAAAILFVLRLHSFIFTPLPLRKYSNFLYVDGVTLFFVLSGFLIGQIILKTYDRKRFNIRQLTQFWYRRWMRTLPAFYVTISLLFLYEYFHHTIPYNGRVFKTFIFSQCFSAGNTDFFREGWSLSVEEWFYLLIPFSLSVLHYYFNIPWKKLLIGAIIFVIVLTEVVISLKLKRMPYLNNRTANGETAFNINIKSITYLRFETLMIGVLAAYLFYYKKRIWEYKNFWFWSGIVLFIIIPFASKYLNSYRIKLSGEAIATLFLLPKLNSIKTDKGLIYQIVTYISLISYSLYLLNYSAFHAVVMPFYDKYWFQYYGTNTYFSFAFLLYFGWAFLAASMMYYLIEKPFMRLRDKNVGSVMLKYKRKKGP